MVIIGLLCVIVMVVISLKNVHAAEQIWYYARRKRVKEPANNSLVAAVSQSVATSRV